VIGKIVSTLQDTTTQNLRKKGEEVHLTFVDDDLVLEKCGKHKGRNGNEFPKIAHECSLISYALETTH